MRSLKQWLPPELLRIARHALGHGGHFRGTYESWEQASKAAQGYDAGNILERVLNAALAVRGGKAAYERDGVMFVEPYYPYELLVALLRAAALNNGALRVLDFGGALGSSYFQCKPWLKDLKKIDWCVVEQPHFVAAGNQHLANEELHFANSIEEAAKKMQFDVVLFSGVLQYIESPFKVLLQGADLRPRFIIIDRTPVIEGGLDIIRLQKQKGKNLVRSSYPVRLFSPINLTGVMTRGYRLLACFNALDAPMGGIGSRADFKGYIFEREGI